MHLTKKQERMLSGGEGEATRKAMEILVGLGDIYGAQELIPIQSAHISGMSITTSGEAGLSFIEEMVDKGAEVKVPTTTNPAGMDLENWERLGVPEELAKKQIGMVEAYRKIGAKPTCSCTPYLIGNKPSYGDHIAWSESSAIVYANSILGARTNREGAPSALASAITGLTPNHGYHFDENRQGDVEIIPDTTLLEGESTFPYSILGYWIGENFSESVPVIKELNPNPQQHKALGAGMAASGAIALYHIPDITAGAKKNPEICRTEEKAHFESEDFEDVVGELNQVDDADLICIGCPHSSIEEIRKLSNMDTEKEVWICLARGLREDPKLNEDLENLQNEDVKFVCDTCMVVAPLSEMGYSKIGVNSAKAAHYAPSLAGVKVHLAPLEDLLK